MTPVNLLYIGVWGVWLERMTDCLVYNTTKKNEDSCKQVYYSNNHLFIIWYVSDCEEPSLLQLYYFIHCKLEDVLVFVDIHIFCYALRHTLYRYIVKAIYVEKAKHLIIWNRWSIPDTPSIPNCKSFWAISEWRTILASCAHATNHRLHSITNPPTGTDEHTGSK